MKYEAEESWNPKKFESNKFEIEVWSWSAKLKFESWRNYGWRKLKLINLKLKKFEGNEIWTWWYLKLETVKDIWSYLRLLKIKDDEIWSRRNLKFKVEENLKLKKFKSEESWNGRKLDAPLEVLTIWTESKRKTVFVITFQSKNFSYQRRTLSIIRPFRAYGTIAKFISAREI